MKAIGLWLGLALVIAASAPSGAGEQRASKPGMVIQVGWTSPDTQYLRLHAKEIERIPFSGVASYVSWPCIDAGGVENSSGTGSLSWAMFENERFKPEMLKVALKDVRETRYRRFTSNFMTLTANFNGEHGRTFDWFDDSWWRTVCGNARDLARIAREGKYRGIFFDPEEYGYRLWSWGGTRPDYALKTTDLYKGKSYENVRDKVRQRGREFIRAINQGFPGCTFWTAFAYGIASGIPVNEKDISDRDTILLMAFMDGMLEASDENTIFVDGCEQSYRFSEREEFARLREAITEKALAFSLVPDTYRKKMRIGFGLYMDMYNYPGSHSWYSDRPEDNYMTPALLEKAIGNALQVGDGYVWIYSEYPSWWLGRGETAFGEGVRSRGDHKSISPVYWRAIGRARAVGG